MSGVLYVCATPIGNLEDASIRLIKVLRSVDIIACEDTRRTAKLLQRFRIKTPMTSYHKHNLREKEAYLVDLMLSGGRVALVSDAGTPGISDPGELLVRRARAEGIKVEVVPGPSALLAALVVSGLDTSRFVFEGFIPARDKERRDFLMRLASEPRTIVLYEAPHRLLRTLEDMEQIWGERQMAVARELTKVHEEVVQGTPAELRQHFAANPCKGELTLVIEGCRQRRESVSRETLLEEVQELIDRGIEKKEAFRLKAREYGIKKSDIYSLYLEAEKATDQRVPD